RDRARARRRAAARRVPVLPRHARRAAAAPRPRWGGARRLRARARAHARRARAPLPARPYRRALSVTVSPVDEILGFRRRLQQRSAERIVPTEHGTAILSESIRHVYDANY